MISMRTRRWLAIGLFGAAGSAGAFGVGASLATKLERHTHSVSVAKIPVRELSEAMRRTSPPPSPPSAVAKK